MNPKIIRLAIMTLALAATPIIVGQETKTSESNTAIKSKKKTETDGSAEEVKPFSNRHFSSVTQLMVGEKPLNTKARQMYPSPAMFDVDNDGQDELIVGDIFGSLNVYENENEGNGDPVWSEFTSLKSTDGDKIKVSNW